MQFSGQAGKGGEGFSVSLFTGKEELLRRS